MEGGGGRIRLPIASSQAGPYSAVLIRKHFYFVNSWEQGGSNS